MDLQGDLSAMVSPGDHDSQTPFSLNSRSCGVLESASLVFSDVSYRKRLAHTASSSLRRTNIQFFHQVKANPSVIGKEIQSMSLQKLTHGHAWPHSPTNRRTQFIIKTKPIEVARMQDGSTVGLCAMSNPGDRDLQTVLLITVVFHVQCHHQSQVDVHNVL